MVASVFAHFDGVISNFDHGGRKFGSSPVSGNLKMSLLTVNPGLGMNMIEYQQPEHFFHYCALRDRAQADTSA